MVSQGEIIQQLNYAARSYGIPMLDIYYPIAARMSAYRTAHHRGLVIELFEFNDSCIGHACPRTRVFCFGDALQQAPGRSGLSLHVTGDGPSGPLFDPEGAEQSISSSARDMAIRGKIVPITIEPREYAQLGGHQARRSSENPRLRIAAASSLPRYQDLFFATESELAERLGEGHAAPGSGVRVAAVLRRLYGNARRLRGVPNDCRCHVHIDPGRYRPTQRPNTHWSNWPDAPVV